MSLRCHPHPGARKGRGHWLPLPVLAMTCLLMMPAAATAQGAATQPGQGAAPQPGQGAATHSATVAASASWSAPDHRAFDEVLATLILPADAGSAPSPLTVDQRQAMAHYIETQGRLDPHTLPPEEARALLINLHNAASLWHLDQGQPVGPVVFANRRAQREDLLHALAALGQPLDLYLLYTGPDPQGAPLPPIALLPGLTDALGAEAAWLRLAQEGTITLDDAGVVSLPPSLSPLYTHWGLGTRAIITHLIAHGDLNLTLDLAAFAERVRFAPLPP